MPKNLGKVMPAKEKKAYCMDIKYGDYDYNHRT